MSPPKWIKDTYIYKIFRAGMSAFLAKYFWDDSQRYNPETQYKEILMRQCFAVVMFIMGLCQLCINVGLIGDSRDSKKKKKRD